MSRPSALPARPSAVAPLAVALMICIPTIATPDPAALSTGGSPAVMTRASGIRMDSEHVHVRVLSNRTAVDGSYAFYNSGPARTVRLGFPDEGYWAYADSPPSGPRSSWGSFTFYRISVDGHPKHSHVERGDRRGLFWRETMVRFPAHSALTIHISYHVPNGGRPAYDSAERWGGVYITGYTLSSGASWTRPIGYASVAFTFDTSAVAQPLDPRPDHGSLTHPGAAFFHDWSSTPGRIYYDGPCAPTASGRTLSFTLDNFKPTRASDILLYYGMFTRLKQGRGTQAPH